LLSSTRAKVVAPTEWIKTHKAVAALLLAVGAAGAHGQQGTAQHSMSGYLGRGVDADLQEIPKQLFTGPKWDDTYFAGLGYRLLAKAPPALQSAFDWLRIPRTRVGFEGVVVKHWGLQQQWEADAALVLMLPPLTLGPVDMTFSGSWGLSYALGRPSYEDGPQVDPDRRYRFQSYSAYELDFQAAAFPAWSVVGRVHHRSGVYGVIAPRRVGSNFLTVGVRFTH
jgi:hypothetical protein